MTSFQKVLILVGLLQCEIAYGMWGINPWSCLMSPVTVVTNLPVISTGVEFGRLVADPKTRDTFLQDSVRPTVLFTAAAAFGLHKYLGMALNGYTNESVGKKMLFGGAICYAIWGSVNDYNTGCLLRRFDRMEQNLGQKIQAVDQRVVLVGREVVEFRQAALPAIVNTSEVVNRIEPKVSDTAAAAERLEVAVGAVAGQAQVLGQRQEVLALGVSDANSSLRQQGDRLAGLQDTLGRHGATLSAVGQRVDGVVDTQAQHGSTLAGLRQEVGAAAEAAAEQHQAVTESLDGLNQKQAAMAKTLDETAKGVRQLVGVAGQLRTQSRPPVVPQDDNPLLKAALESFKPRTNATYTLSRGSIIPGVLPLVPLQG